MKDLLPLPHGWDFQYEPLGARDSTEPGGDLVLATTISIDAKEVERTLEKSGERVTAEVILARAPLFWMRIRGSSNLTAAALLRALEALDLPVRYVAPATCASTGLAPPLNLDSSMRARPSDWRVRDEPRAVEDPPTATRWFLGPAGIALDRVRCGTGAGTRIAIIDDDGADAGLVGFERECPVGVASVCRASPHGTLVAAWAVGAVGERAFRGIAPAASPRLYAIPKAGAEIVSLARAIATAVFDGADVIVCATYVEQAWSPMLDDALTVATRLGRRGRGTAIVMPSGREASSPPHSSHASWSLSLGDPASDPRVFCIGPSGRGGSWFLWPDRRGRLRPFANRGPAVRWLAPGDDLADPLEERDRWCHAESSGAAALAAGVLLLVIAANPKVSLRELDAVVTRTASAIRSNGYDDLAAPVADPFDLLPRDQDGDRHNAKHGYGRMNARHACLAVRDPIAAALLEMGEARAAVAAFDVISRTRLYSRRTARWMARQILVDASLAHGLKVALRHLRLVAANPRRASAHAKGSLARQLGLLSRALGADERVPCGVAEELRELSRRLAGPGVDALLVAVARDLWPLAAPAERASTAKNVAAPVSKGGSLEPELA